jgi:hypothetical protein
MEFLNVENNDCLLLEFGKMTVTECLFLATVAEQAAMFQDMKEFCMPILYVKGSYLGEEERNLLSTAFKGLIKSKRTAINIISDFIEDPENY